MSPAVALLAALATGSATALLLPGAAALPDLRDKAPGPRPVEPVQDAGWLRRFRLPLSLLTAVAGAVVLGGPLAPVGGLAAGAGCWVVIARAEPAERRERREDVRRSLPHVVALFAAALRSGAAPGPALSLVAEALPGPATDAARAVAARLDLGVEPSQAWRGLAGEPGLASWGRAMARAHETGAPVVGVVDRLADDLAREARAQVEDAARTVGVRAAVPLGLCLLPAFLLIGIVPLVAGLLGALW